MDIVCAAVSALLGALAIGLTEVVGAPVSLEAGDGHFLVRVPAGVAGEEPVRVLMETAVRALEGIEENYRGTLKIRWLRP